MTSDLNLPLRGYQLSCRHWVRPEGEQARNKDGWYAPMPCPHCRRKRAVICASFGNSRLAQIQHVVVSG